ncbi:MAG: FAD:protein FMN transferase [Planctomycetota bacterium]|nr:MAG: FAD:protein FMN transferase [Planctomycetota bacterium]REK26918.1 MAG: FAD:protein FMN transferase [Planctomycetota bacterium]REK35407.1 MAG: FAD:protein FMN transferase [Planctomycetota bacterium]
MPDDFPDSTRRDLLSGRAIVQRAAHAQDVLADAVVDAQEGRRAPRGFDTVRLETRAMACPWSVVMDPGPARQVMWASDALSIVHELEQQLSVYRDDSEVSAINREATESAQPVEEGLFRFLVACRDLSRFTGGAFDIAVRALILLWRDCRQSGRIPVQEEIDAALAISGMDHVTLDEDSMTVSFDAPGVGIDLGAVGKGFAIDRAAAFLDEQGLENYLLHGGYSSLLARGEHCGQAGWPVGIKNPLFTETRYATILLRDQALSTSGSNVQFFRYHGKRYGHILDPRTGWPADGLLSVTVTAPTASEADALSTAFYVMGLENAQAYCDNHSQVGALLIPSPAAGRTLQPIICNIPEETLFFAAAERADKTD